MNTQEFKQTIADGIKAAMVAKDKVRLETLRSVNGAITNAEKAESAKEIDVLKIIETLAKQRKQSIDAFTKGRNFVMAHNEQMELEILEEFLPKKMDDSELVLALNDVIMAMNPVPTIKDMGKVIAAFKAVHPNEDMGKVSGMIKKVLPAS